MKNNYAKRQKEEELASGILPEISAVDDFLQGIITRFKELYKVQRKEIEDKK